MSRTMPTGAEMDDLAAMLDGTTCPLCGRRFALSVTKPRYGWGSQGSRAECLSCGLQLRFPWVPLKRAVRSVR